MNIFKTLLISGIILLTASCASNPVANNAVLAPEPVAEDVPFVVVLEGCDKVKYVFVSTAEEVMFMDVYGLRVNYNGSLDFFLASIEQLAVAGAEPVVVDIAQESGVLCL